MCGESLSVDVKPFYSELNLNQYSVGSPCRTICTVCGSPPCPDLNLIHYINNLLEYIMSEHNTIIVNWKGPFTYDEIQENPEMGNGLYLAAGKQKYERESLIQYCGITEGSFARRFKDHHKIPQITREQEF